jgi:hypothetical protein
MGSIITMANGTAKPIEQIQAGDFVLSLNPEYKLEPKRVSHVHDNGVKQTLNIRTTGRTLRCTPNHPFLANNEWIESGNLKLGDLVAVPKKVDFFADEPMNEDDLDILAIWLAEGHGYIISNGTPEIVEIIHRVAAKWGCPLRQWAEVDWYFNGGSHGQGESKHPLRMMLERYGLWPKGSQCGLNSKTKFIPDAVFRLPKCQLARFLNLFFACDGSIYCRVKGGQPTGCMGLANERMLKEIGFLLGKFGIRGQIRKKIHKATGKDGKPFVSWDLAFSDAESIIAFADNIGALGKEDKVSMAREMAVKSQGSCNAYLPLQTAQAVQALVYDPVVRVGRALDLTEIPDAPKELLAVLRNWRKQSPHRISKRRFEQMRPWMDSRFDGLAYGDAAWEEVLSIEVAGECQTYDLTVEDNHNFIAEGFITHNTENAKRKLIKRALKGSDFYPARYFAAAPTYLQAKGIWWSDLQALLPGEFIVGISKSELSIKLINGSEIVVVGLDRPARIEGQPWDGGVIDEIANVKEEAWPENIRPVLSDRNGWCDLIGVPEGRGAYYRMVKHAEAELLQYGKDSEWGVFHWKSADILPAKEIESARRSMDETTFQQEYEASFVSFEGRIYYTFDSTEHTAKLRHMYDPKQPLIVALDFNVAPGVAAICQEMSLPNGMFGTGAIGEVYIDRGSNTPAVCRKIAADWGEHQGRVLMYGDATGGAQGSAKVSGSDWELVAKELRPVFGGRLEFHVPSHNPAERSRVNAVNTRFKSADGAVRAMVDPFACPHLVEDLEGVRALKGGSGEIDKKIDPKLTHISDAFGYYVAKEFPVADGRMRKGRARV